MIVLLEIVGISCVVHYRRKSGILIMELVLVLDVEAVVQKRFHATLLISNYAVKIENFVCKFACCNFYKACSYNVQM